GGAGDDTFNFGAGGSLSGQIDGGAGTGDAVDYTALGAITVTLGTGVTNIEDLLGATAATLAGGNTWVVTGANTGTVDGFNFSGFGNISGTTGDDSFTLNAGGTLSGTLDGGAGSDTLTGAQIVNVALTGSGANGFSGTNAAITGNFTGIDVISGAGGGTLTGSNTTNTWTLDGTPTLTVGSATLSFEGFAILQGGTGADTFDVSAASTFDLLGGAGADSFNLDATLTGSIDGEAGTDTVTGADDANTWTVNADNAGDVDGVAFTSVENLVGGAGVDQFDLSAGVSGSITGGAGADVIDVVASFAA